MGIFEALEDARLRLDSDTSNLEHLRAAKQKERNELMKSGVTVYDGPFEVDEAMLLRPEFVVRHLLTTADIPEPETIDTTTKKKMTTKKKKKRKKKKEKDPDVQERVIGFPDGKEGCELF